MNKRLAAVALSMLMLPLLSAAGAAAPSPPLAAATVNDIAKTPALKASAMTLGGRVYGEQCASCHGADLKGLPAQHTPDLTDAAWLHSGDDLESGGIVMFPADVEKTVLYGVRSGHPMARGEAKMPAFGAAGLKLLNEAETDDVIDYILVFAGREAETRPDKVERGAALYKDKGNCWDCHSDDGIGNGAIGATDFTADLWLYGGDRASLARSILEGAAGVMPGYEGKLSPEEIKAVSVYVFDHAKAPE